MASSLKPVRCAIYTRKSSEEGLEQDFNSLHAQREACEAYIRSQKQEGWLALPVKYDDGGYSGGTIVRPALEKLLTEIKEKKIDVVVVYKIDRLTRSLFDFAKIVEIFDAGGVSFVSITQQFNTTTSMGRLTLNVLLSFAQFEREVTGERIRDKIAASKRKGMWMGGCVPLGYETKGRQLHVREDDARGIRHLYDLYLELGTVQAVKGEADRLGIIRRSSGRYPGGLLSQGYIYRVLTNPIYAGKISHKRLIHEGQHEPIVSLQTWQRVQGKLQENAARKRLQPTASEPSPLAGIIFDHTGERLTTGHAVKSGRRYRYYIASGLVEGIKKPGGLRISAPEVEGAVCSVLLRLLRDEQKLSEILCFDPSNPSEIEDVIDRSRILAQELGRLPSYTQLAKLRPILIRITIGFTEITLALDAVTLTQIIMGRQEAASKRMAETESISANVISASMRLGRRGRETRLILQNGNSSPRPVDRSLRNLVARGYAWRQEILSGQSASATGIAKREGVTSAYVSRLIDLSFLAPDIITAILSGTAPVDLTAHKLRSFKCIPLDWPSQRAVLGLSQ